MTTTFYLPLTYQKSPSPSIIFISTTKPTIISLIKHLLFLKKSHLWRPADPNPYPFNQYMKHHEADKEKGWVRQPINNKKGQNNNTQLNKRNTLIYILSQSLLPVVFQNKEAAFEQISYIANKQGIVKFCLGCMCDWVMENHLIVKRKECSNNNESGFDNEQRQKQPVTPLGIYKNHKQDNSDNSDTCLIDQIK